MTNPDEIFINFGEDGIEIDFDNVKEGFEPMPEGTFTVEVQKVEQIAKSEKSGQPYLKFVMEVQDEPFKGRTLFMNLSFSPGALWKLKRALMALGLTPGKGFKLVPENLVGLQCLAAVGTEEYQGKTKNVINELMPLGGAVDPTMTSVQAPF